MADLAARIARARFRAWHRGTREADLLIGGFFERYHAGWGAEELAWFETLLEHDDPQVLDWALGVAEPPNYLRTPMLSLFQNVDFVTIL